jgi:tetratricopeptide (TPR) repeat protein
MSPSFWWNGEESARRARTFLEEGHDFDASIFFGIGTEDGTGMQNELTRFVATLEEQPRAGLRWEHRVFEGEGHMSAPLLVNYYGLKFVFDEMRLPGQLSSSYDDAAFRAHEAGIVERFGSAAKQSGETYVTLGLKLMKEENHAGAITVLERNAEAYPIFPPNYAWLAQAYEGNGQPAKALESYREALRRSRAINYGEGQEYTSQIERLQR